jgi:hypothetical protein
MSPMTKPLPSSPRKSPPLNARWSSDDLQINFRPLEDGLNGGPVTSTPFASLNRSHSRNIGKMSRRPQSAEENKSTFFDAPSDVLTALRSHIPSEAPIAEVSRQRRTRDRSATSSYPDTMMNLDPDLASILLSRPGSAARLRQQRAAPPPLSVASSSRTPTLTPEQVSNLTKSQEH